MGLGSFPSRIPGLLGLSNPRPKTLASERPLPKAWHQMVRATAAPPQARKCGVDRAPAGPAAATCYPGSRDLGTRCSGSGGRPGAPASPRSPAPASRSRSDRHPCSLRRAPAGCTAASLLLWLLSPPPPRPSAAPRGPGTSEPPRCRLPRPPAPLPPRQPPRRKGRRSRAPTTALQPLGAGASPCDTPGTPGHQLCLLGKGA